MLRCRSRIGAIVERMRVNYILVAAAGLSLLVACGGGVARDDPDSVQLVRIDRVRCLPSSRLESSREGVAILCAEAFVARNGYTDALPVSDTTQLAFESIEWQRSLTALLAHRRNTLESSAYGVCPLGAVGPGLAVVFRYRADTVRNTGRAVTMTAGFDSLRVQHRDFILANVADSGAACSRVTYVRGQISEPSSTR